MKKALIVVLVMALLVVFAALVPTVHAENVITVASAYGSQNNQHLTTFTDSPSGIKYRFVSADGTQKGSPIPVTGEATAGNSAIAYDSLLDRFLVAWGQYDGPYYVIKGRILESDGTFVGNEINIGSNSDNNGSIKIAYSPTSQRYLAAFFDATTTSVAGQFINSDGTLEGSNFTVITGTVNAREPDVAYDSINHRFLVAALTQGGGAPPMYLYGVILNDNGTVYTSQFSILDSGTYLYQPAIAYDPVNQRFLAIWEVYFGDGHELWGQLINANGTLEGTHQVIVSSHTVTYANDVIYHAGSGRFLVAWSDDRGGIYGQEVNSDGTNYGSEFSIVNPHQPYNVSLAYNSTWENTLVTYKVSNNIAAYITTGTPLPNSTLTVNKTGQGSGTVSSVPTGINCGAECSENYLNSTTVTLTATADSGFVFEGWNGGGCTGTGTCVVPINGDVTVTATFNLPSEVLPAVGTIGTQITITGSGFGDKKGKVLIGGVAAKITKDGWADDRIIALLTKVPPPGGPYDVTINLKSKPPASILLEDAFTVRSPRISSYSLSSARPGNEVTVNGFYFGGKKGKVYLVSETGSNKPKSCKVTYWYMDPTDGTNSEIKFMIPKVEPGSYWLYINNKAGSSPIDVPFRVD